MPPVTEAPKEEADSDKQSHTDATAQESEYSEPYSDDTADEQDELMWDRATRTFHVPEPPPAKRGADGEMHVTRDRKGASGVSNVIYRFLTNRKTEDGFMVDEDEK